MQNAIGLNIQYTITGQGHPLLFLHGAYINEEIWERQIPYFEERFTVVSVRLPSHCSAPALDVDEYRVEDFTQVLFDLLDELEIPSCTVIGLSLGSMIAQNMAARFPDRIDGLVLIGNVASMRLTILERTVTGILFPKWLALWLFGNLNTKQFLKLSFLMTWFMRGNNWLGNRDTRQKIREMISGTQREEIKRIFAAVHTFRRQKLDSGTFPLLLINGEFDSPIIHHHARHLLNRYPSRARFEQIPGAGHACNYDQPDTFNPLVENWIREKVVKSEVLNGTDYTSEYSRSL